MKVMETLCLKNACLLIAVLDILVLTVDTTSRYTTVTHYFTSVLPEYTYARLVNGSSIVDGTIVIYANMREYIACNASEADGIVICKMQGMRHGPASPQIPGHFLYRYGNIFTDSFQCHGSETNIRLCSPKPSSYGGCYAPELDCRTKVRLVEGNNVSFGIIEIQVNGTWGTVCDTNFDYRDADVFCRMLGHNGTRNRHLSGVFNPLNRSGPIWLDNLDCNGFEADVAACRFSGWGKHNCGHNNDVWLHCDVYTTPWSYHKTTSPVRNKIDISNFHIGLVDGYHNLSGLVELRSKAYGIHFCYVDVTSYVAEVMCRMAGFKYGAASVTLQGKELLWTDFVYQGPYCYGHEEDLTQCLSSLWSHLYKQCNPLFIDCRTPIRLNGGSGYHNGFNLLEILVNGTWGTACADSFGQEEATVVCRMLGYYSGTTNSYGYGFSPQVSTGFGGNGPIWLDDLNCTGNEYDIATCMTKRWGEHDCSHSDDVWISCYDSNLLTTSSYSTKSWWHYTTMSYLVENAISSSCTSNGWNIQVDMYRLRQMYPDARASDIYLGENSCTGYSNGYTLIFQHGIRSCLTSETETQTALVYRNRLFYAMRDPKHPFIIRGYNWTVDVECDVMRNETVSNHISHNTQRPLDSGHVQGISHYNVSVRFYTDPNFQYEIPGNPLHVKVGDDVYVKAYTDTADWAVKMAVHTCYTKPDPYASDSMKYYLIKDGCESDENTHYISQSTHETKFMFRDFEYTSNHEGLFIYCDSTFCDTSDYSNQCQQSCNPIGKRSAESRPRQTETVQERIIHDHK